MIGRDCRCPGCGTCGAADEVERLRRLSDSKNAQRIAAEHRAMAVERERDELKTRLAHAEADAEQAIHNEAFNERMKIVAWMRNRIAHLSLDSRTTMQALDALLSMAVEIEQGERGPGLKPEPNLRADNAKLREENARLRAALRGLFKPDSIPYAQWTREMHAAHIALESE